MVVTSKTEFFINQISAGTKKPRILWREHGVFMYTLINSMRMLVCKAIIASHLHLASRLRGLRDAKYIKYKKNTLFE